MSETDKPVPPGEDETLPLRPEYESNSGPELSSADQDTLASDSPSSLSGDTSIPEVEGYEILSELGRGGMGLVYKARNLKLDRTVALKMILGGRFATSDELQRFRIEAESAARLDHPAIVPIYDIADANGNHFYSMKFIDGGPLSDASEKYQADARAAAELMCVVAGAVQHAHERGVLHRDLKPANILIDENGNPLVTDLGLAKQMDDESGLTQTGLAMGTPGFMAPEQAQGRKDITTAADIFSLGAILYWLQTGEPPFKRETAMKTVLATLNEDAPSVRASKPGADLDLDLICQKAMSRDPGQRYSSAAAFARDLEAWLSGELISIRAPTAVSLASMWVRKNLRVVLTAGIAGIVCGLIVGGIYILGGLSDVARQEHELTQLGHNQPTWVSHFVGLRHVGEEWKALQTLIVPVVAVCALMNVLLLRPQSREASTISAVTAALSAGAVAFLMGIGWPAMTQASIQRGTQDIELLASAVWLESDVERELAQQALIQRYPGLEGMDQGTRQHLVFEKIKHDQKVGIMPGTWSGVSFAILFVVLPMLMTCVLSGIAWLDGFRGWHWFGCTLERSVYCVMFFTIIALWLMPVPPSLHLTLISLAMMALALVVAVRDGQWYWRVALGLAPVVFMYALNYDMIGQRYSANRAGLATTDDELREHAVQMNRFVAHTHDPFVHYKAGIAWLSIGNDKEYQRHCRQLLSNFENAFRPEIASRLAKLSLLKPELQNPGDRPTFYKLAEFASGFESSLYRPWFFLTRAISEQRQGNAEAAFDWNKRARDSEGYSGYMEACTHVVDALAYLDNNDLASAKKSLKAGQDVRDAIRQKSFSDGHDVGWVDWRVFLIFEEEAISRMTAAEQSNA